MSMIKRILIISMFTLLMLTVLTGCNNNEAPAAAPPESQGLVSNQAGSDSELYAKYLTIADVEEVTGMTGLTSREEAITLTFFSDDGTDILEVRFDGNSFYDAEVGANEEYYTPVSDLGDKAAICIPAMPYKVTFLQGDHCIMVQTIPQSSDLPVTEDQLITLAKIVASRL